MSRPDRLQAVSSWVSALDTGVSSEVAEDAAVTGIAADRAHSTDAVRPFADKREIFSSAREARHEFS
jgi:hypothetical protein